MIFRYKSHFSTIAIISGGPNYDHTAARLIDIINNSSPQKVNFVGSIGSQYSHKLNNIYASNSILDHEEIIVNRNYNEHKIENILCPFRTNTHIRNYMFVGKIAN